MSLFPVIVYWADADVFIQAKNGPYKFERVPQFWSFLAEQIRVGSIRCPKKVYDELTDGKDQLAQWCKTRRRDLCAQASRDVQRCFGNVATHVHGNYSAPKAAEFLSGGDGWVIAHAMEMGVSGIVVTQESERHHNAKVKVPTVCQAIGVRCINTYEMLEALDFKITGA